MFGPVCDSQTLVLVGRVVMQARQQFRVFSESHASKWLVSPKVMRHPSAPRRTCGGQKSLLERSSAGARGAMLYVCGVASSRASTFSNTQTDIRMRCPTRPRARDSQARQSSLARPVTATCLAALLRNLGGMGVLFVRMRVPYGHVFACASCPRVRAGRALLRSGRRGISSALAAAFYSVVAETAG